ncbi:MAG: N-acetyl-gamma-glutamyl-phosphate reductase [Lentilactobacillus diolivorans]
MEVALVGITGYAGMVLYQLLQNHPNVTKIHIYDHNLNEPTELNTILPIFHDDHTEVLPYEDSDIVNDNQVAFFATPAGVTSKIASNYIEANFPVIDLSGDMRLNQSDYEHWYHKPAASQRDLDQAQYGLAEFESASGHSYIANPGCYATATLLGLAPLIQQHLIELNSIIVDAKSGTSGAGKALSPLTHFTQVNDNLQIYKPNTHQHIPEIVNELQSWDINVSAIQFMTTLIPVTRGIMATIYAKAKPGVDGIMIDKAFSQTYNDKPFVHFLGETLPDIKQVVGTNNCDIGAIYNPATNTVTIDSVIDNLLKGAAGQAIQNFNQLFDYPESSGLNLQTFLP